MPKFTVEIHETQHWTYSYEVEAKSSEEAHHIAETRHFADWASDDEWLCESNITGTYAKEHEEGDRDYKNGGFVNAEEERIYNLNMEGK